MARRTRKKGQLSARQAMHARRAVAPETNPCPPDATGGQYQPLTETHIQQIFDSALRILAEIGMGEAPQALIDQAVSKGATVNDTGRLFFPRSMVEDTIAGACKSFPLYGRDPQHDITVGGDSVYFGTGGAAVQTLDLDTRTYRSATLRDLYDFTRLADTLTNISWFTRCCVSTDIADITELDINTADSDLLGS